MAPTALDLSRVVNQMYETALEPELWQGAMQAVAEALSASIASVLLQDFGRGTFPFAAVSANLPEEALDQYFAYYHSIDILRAGALHFLDGNIGTETTLASTSHPHYRQIYQDFYERWDMGRTLGTTVVKNDSYGVILAVYRTSRMSPFSTDELRHCSLLLPHIGRAVRIRHRLAELSGSAQVTNEAIECLTMGVMFIDRRGRVVSMNRSARDIVAANDGLTLNDGQPSAAYAYGRLALRKLIDRATRPELLDRLGASLFLQRPSRKRPLSVFVTPVTGSEALATGSAAIIFVSDPASSIGDGADRLRRAYGLSPAETGVAISLCEGKSVKQISDALQVSQNTVRTQLKSILAKTNVHRQAELVTTLLRGPLATRDDSTGAQSKKNR